MKFRLILGGRYRLKKKREPFFSVGIHDTRKTKLTRFPEVKYYAGWKSECISHGLILHQL